MSPVSRLPSVRPLVERSVSGRTVPYILAVLFAASGGAKLASLPFEVEAFARWGYSPAFMYVTGVLEVAGAIGLLVRRLSGLTALCLAGLMVGAVATHVIHSEWPMAVVASTILVVTAWWGWHERARMLPARCLDNV